MASKERKSFENPVVEWIDSRLPLFTMMQKEYGVFPTPRNFNYFWNFGAIAMVMLVTMILTGISLAMHYNPSAAGAFDSVERIMRDVNHGWLIRYLHMNGASFFFIAVYTHIFRGLYYGSYKKPRELLWLLGMTIFLLMMATGFMGYVLPWGQMSFWGATVITNLFSAIPLVGDSIVTLLWGGFSVDNPTLNRFFALHYLLPFVIVGVVFLHVWALHVTGSNNPLGIDVKGEQDTLPFHPYYTMKDMFGLILFLIVYVAFTFFMPNALGHPDNYIPANPLVTPAHIVPEWYFLPFYAILRAITFDLNLYLAGAGAITALLIYNYCWRKVPDARVAARLPILLITAAVLGLPGALLAFFHDVPMLKGIIDLIPLKAISVMPAKLGGVLAMGGAIAVLFLLPFIDNHPVRSSRFRPWYRPAVLTLLFVFVVLGVCGSKPAEGLWVPLAQVMTLGYFGFFLIAVPFFNNHEPVKILPDSIHQAIFSAPKSLILMLVGVGLLSLTPHYALAKNFSAAAATEAEGTVAAKPAPDPVIAKTPAAPVSGPAELTPPEPAKPAVDVTAPPADQKAAAPQAAKPDGPSLTPGAQVPAATDTTTEAAPAGQPAPQTTQSASESSHEGAAGDAVHAQGSSGHEEIKLMDEHWGFQSPVGSYDRAALQRGYQVYKQVCSACHSMKRVAYRNLSALGYSEAQIKSVAAEYTVMDGPNDDGEMFERPARPSDHFKSPYPNDNASRAANNGALPPDLSLIVKAREGGARYVFSLLNGYEPPPPGTDMAANQYWNRYMAGNKIAMSAPLSDGVVTYEDGSPATVRQYGHDVAEFLSWASEPEMEERKQTGIKALIFLIALGAVMYMVKRKIWANVH